MRAIAVVILLALILAIGTGFGNWQAKQRPVRAKEPFGNKLPHHVLLSPGGPQGVRKNAVGYFRTAPKSANQAGSHVDPERQPGQTKSRQSGMVEAELGSRQIRRGRLAEAIPTLSQAIEKLELWVRECSDDSQSQWALAQAMGDLGVCYLSLGRLNDAESRFRKSVSHKLEVMSRFPDNCEYLASIAESYHHLGVLYQRRGDVRNSKQSFYESIRWKRQRLGVSPESSEARFQLAVACSACARMLDSAGRSQLRPEAATVYSKAYDLLAALVVNHLGNSRYFREHYLLVNAYAGFLCANRDTDEVERIRSRLDRYMEQLDPLTSRHAQWQVGLMHAVQGRLLRMLGDGDEAIRQDQITIECLSKMVDELSEQLDDGARRSDWESVEGQCQLAWQLVLCSVHGLRNPVRSEELVRDVMKQSSDDARLWVTLGAAQYLQGEWTAAIASLRRSLDRPLSETGVSCFLLAMAQWQLGAKEASRRWYQQGVEWTEDYRPHDCLLAQLREEAAVLLGER